MTFTYNRDIPDAPNNPSNDQPLMKTNTNSIDDWTAVDHVKFSSAPAGTHLQVTLSSKNTPGAQIDPQSVLYTGNGSASTVAQLLYANQNNASFPLSSIRAFGSFVTVSVNGAVLLTNSKNVLSVTSSGLGLVFTIVLDTNVVNGNDLIVLPFLNSGSANYTYTFTNPNLVLTRTNNLPGIITNFIVLQF